MHFLSKTFVHVPVNAVDTVVQDPECRLDPERFDHYETYEAARDAALSSIEIMLDEQDYDDEKHRAELEQMQGLLETAADYAELAKQPFHRKLVRRMGRELTAAA